GELNADNHAQESEWIKTDSAHSKVYPCCNKVILDNTQHTWNSGTCSECGHVCQHSSENDLCLFTPISTIEELKSISMQGKYYLTNDIDMGNAEWSPLGTPENEFEGIFDGNGYSISNFKITNGIDYAGLFNANSGEIRNLGIKNFYITMTSSSSDSFAGGLVAYNTGKIKNCYAIGSIGSTSDESIVGGLIGANQNKGIVTNCYAATMVSGEYAGGLIAFNAGTVTDCYATGNVSSLTFNGVYIGGFIGYNNGGAITNCYSTGNVSALSTSELYAGGFIGYTRNGEIKNCYATGNINTDVVAATNGNAVGGFIGQNGYTGGNGETAITNCYCSDNQKITILGASQTNVEVPKKTTSELQSATFQASTLTWSSDIWNLTDNAFPTLKN
ncbi:MAG: hypothetical protein E7678_05595, partial [Ruminococcaceae bacterium]|nr:hypothetical protein [Oscillospiraceae bacterium]